MALYIEIGNSQIKVLDVLKKKTESSIVSYKIIDKEFNSETLNEIADEIKSINVKNKGSKIIANNNNVYYRDLKVPALDEKQTLGIIQNELVIGQTSTSEMICDYLALTNADSDGMRRVFGCALPEEIIKSYITLFNGISCKNPAAIEFSFVNLFDYLRATKALDNEATLVVEISKNQARIFLFDENTYILVRNMRMNTEVEDILKFSIKEEVNKMSQFQASRRKEAGIKQIYFFGDYENLEAIVADCRASFGTNVELIPEVSGITYPKDFNYLEYIYTLGSIIGD